MKCTLKEAECLKQKKFLSRQILGFSPFLFVVKYLESVMVVVL